MTDIGTAILKINSTAKTIITGHDIDSCKIEWIDTAEISKEDIKIAMNGLQTEYDALAYSRSRELAYNALNQLELISDDSINGSTTHKDAIIAIKVKYPKPS